MAARLGNFRQTAEQLHLSQPTVTLQIQKLEQAVGVKLFDRVGRQVVLSRAGRQFLPHAEATLRALRSGRDTLAKWQQGYAHTVTVSVSPLVATTYLPRWIRGFQAAHSDVTFTVRVAESPAILSHLLDFTSDLGLSRVEAVHREVRTDRLYADPVVLVGPNTAAATAAAATAADVLAEYPLLTHNHPLYWDSLLLQVRQQFPNVRTMRVSQVHVTLRFIIEGMGVSFLPLSTVHRDLMLGALQEIPCPTFNLPTAATYLLQHRACSPAAAAFADYVRQYMADRPL